MIEEFHVKGKKQEKNHNSFIKMFHLSNIENLSSDSFQLHKVMCNKTDQNIPFNHI